jgi:hypothetical protein
MLLTAKTRLGEVLQEEGRRQDWLVARLRERGVKADKGQVSRWVRGLHVPEEATRAAIADALGRRVADVFPTEGD